MPKDPPSSPWAFQNVQFQKNWVKTVLNGIRPLRGERVKLGVKEFLPFSLRKFSYIFNITHRSFRFCSVSPLLKDNSKNNSILWQQKWAQSQSGWQQNSTWQQQRTAHCGQQLSTIIRNMHICDGNVQGWCQKQYCWLMSVLQILILKNPIWGVE